MGIKKAQAPSIFSDRPATAPNSLWWSLRYAQLQYEFGFARKNLVRGRGSSEKLSNKKSCSKNTGAKVQQF